MEGIVISNFALILEGGGPPDGRTDMRSRLMRSMMKMGMFDNGNSLTWGAE